jgi:acetolactate synthase I/II/III large subunit
VPDRLRSNSWPMCSMRELTSSRSSANSFWSEPLLREPTLRIHNSLECEVTKGHTRAAANEDPLGALAAVSEIRLLRREVTCPRRKSSVLRFPKEALRFPNMHPRLAHFFQKTQIVADESMTSGQGMKASTRGGPPHDRLGNNTGGSIGFAMPMAVGAAVACLDGVCCA